MFRHDHLACDQNPPNFFLSLNITVTSTKMLSLFIKISAVFCQTNKFVNRNISLLKALPWTMKKNWLAVIKKKEKNSFHSNAGVFTWLKLFINFLKKMCTRRLCKINSKEDKQIKLFFILLVFKFMHFPSYWFFVQTNKFTSKSIAHCRNARALGRVSYID